MSDAQDRHVAAAALGCLCLQGGTPVRRLGTAAIVALALVVTTTAIGEPLAPAPVTKKKKCFKKKHGKRVRVKCKKAKKKPATQTPTSTAPAAPTPTPVDKPGQAAIDQMTSEPDGGRWRYCTSTDCTSTLYVLNLCADGTFLRTGESLG